MKPSVPVNRKPNNPFPVTAKDDVQPSDPKAEPTREEVAKHPEGLIERMERTRRYFRLIRRGQRTHYAKGLDGDPTDFA